MLSLFGKRKNTGVIECPKCHGSGSIVVTNAQMFGIKVLNLRKKHKLTQLDVAKQLKISRTSLANMEAGRQNPPLELIHRLAKILKVETKELF